MLARFAARLWEKNPLTMTIETSDCTSSALAYESEILWTQPWFSFVTDEKGELIFVKKHGSLSSLNLVNMAMACVCSDGARVRHARALRPGDAGDGLENHERAIGGGRRRTAHPPESVAPCEAQSFRDLSWLKMAVPLLS